MSASFKVVIPARYASQRLPGKPLLTLAGKAMILHVCDRALQSGASEVIVATDDQRVFEVVRQAGVEVMMTRSDHLSGTERIAEVAERKGWHDSDIIVNLQGDEPLVAPDYIRDVAQTLAEQQQAGIATLAAPILEHAEIFNPNTVKVILDKQGYALYFSRAPIPWDREHFTGMTNASDEYSFLYLRHIGLYAYTSGFIKRYINWSVTPLEVVESLEQLRVLWYGECIRVLTIPQAPEAGVDTEEDLIRVEKVLSG